MYGNGCIVVLLCMELVGSILKQKFHVKGIVQFIIFLLSFGHFIAVMVNARGNKCIFCKSRQHLYRSCPLYKRLELELATNVGIYKVNYGGTERWVHQQTGHFTSKLTDLVDFGWLLEANSQVWASQRDSGGPSEHLPTLPPRDYGAPERTEMHHDEVLVTIPETETPYQPYLTASPQFDDGRGRPELNAGVGRDRHSEAPVIKASVPFAEPKSGRAQERTVEPSSTDDGDQAAIVTWNDEGRTSCPRTEILVGDVSLPAVIDSNAEVSLMSLEFMSKLEQSSSCAFERMDIPLQVSTRLFRDPTLPSSARPYTHRELVQTNVTIHERTVEGYFLLKYRPENTGRDELVVGKNILRLLIT